MDRSFDRKHANRREDSAHAPSLWDAKLPKDFFARDALIVARDLVGCSLCCGGKVARVVETEAYRGPRDLACHARVGVTERTRALFGAPGTAYVFFVYGMHFCLNVVCCEVGSGHAVLFRALEPVYGFSEDIRLDGPAKLTKNLGISRELNGESFLHDDLFLSARTVVPVIGRTARVGVQYAGPRYANVPWRFFDRSSPGVSRPPARQIGLVRINSGR